MLPGRIHGQEEPGARIHGVTKSWAQLERLTHIHILLYRNVSVSRWMKECSEFTFITKMAQRYIVFGFMEVSGKNILTSRRLSRFLLLAWKIFSYKFMQNWKVELKRIMVLGCLFLTHHLEVYLSYRVQYRAPSWDQLSQKIEKGFRRLSQFLAYILLKP